MKKQTFMATAIVLLTALNFIGCKKDDTKKDYSSLFKNTVWTGELNYSSALKQPLSIEFKEGGLLSWYELSGESSGIWKIENSGISVNLANGSGFKAGISDDNKLTNIQNLPVNNWTIVNAELNTIAEESLDQTTWTTTNLKLHFKAGNKVDMELGPTGATKYNDISYIHKAKTLRYAVVNGDYKWFFVSNSKLVFKGVNQFAPAPAIYPFEISKK